MDQRRSKFGVTLLATTLIASAFLLPRAASAASPLPPVDPAAAFQRLVTRMTRELQCDKPIARRSAKVRDLAPWCGATAPRQGFYSPPQERTYYLGLLATISNKGHLVDELRKSHLQCFVVLDARGICNTISHIHPSTRGEAEAFDRARADVIGAILGSRYEVVMSPPYSDIPKGWARHPEISPVRNEGPLGAFQYGNFHEFIQPVQFPGGGAGYVLYSASRDNTNVCVIPRVRVSGIDSP